MKVPIGQEIKEKKAKKAKELEDPLLEEQMSKRE